MNAEKYVRLTFRLPAGRPFAKGDVGKFLGLADQLRLDPVQVEHLDGALLERHERLGARGKSPLGDILNDVDFRPEPGVAYLYLTAAERERLDQEPNLAARLAGIEYRTKQIRVTESTLSQRIDHCRRAAGLAD